MRKEEFISKEIFEEIEAVGFVSKFIKGTYTEIDGILYDLYIPTYSEVFAWFRYRHFIIVTILDNVFSSGVVYYQFHFRYYRKTYLSGGINCYEDAEKESLDYIMVHFRKMVEDKKAEIESKKEIIDF